MRFQCPQCGNIVLVGNNDFGTAVQCGSCGSVLTVPESRVSLGAVVGDFIIRQELGRGGMGVVYLAHQVSLDRPAALKILADAYANDAEFVVGFIKEARAAAKLNHPHIVQAYAVGEDEGLFYFAMENIDGETMKSVLKREKIIPVNDAIDIIQQIAEALHYAWIEQKLIHRDIKPDNIMLTSSGRAKLADLGLARVAGDIDDTNGDEVMGTPQYISPEHLTGAPMDGRSDIYSLGATFYHFVTGQFPFDGATPTEIAQKHLTAPLVPPSQVNPDVPQCVSRIIEKMMAKNPVMRYQDAEALVEDLRIAKKLIEATSAPITRLKGHHRIDLTAAVTPEDITGERIFSDDTVTRALDSGSLSRKSAKPESSKKSNSDLILLGIVCVLILIVVGAIVAVNFAMKNKNARTAKKTIKITATDSKDGNGKKDVLSLPDRSKEMQAVIDFVKQNGKNYKEARNHCEEFLHGYDEPRTKAEQELYPKIVAYFNRFDEALLKEERAASIAKHEAKLNQVSRQAAADAEADKRAAAAAAKAKADEMERAKQQAAFAAAKKAMETDVAQAENESISEMMCCAIDGDFTGAANAMDNLESKKFQLLRERHDQFKTTIYERAKKVHTMLELMDQCADFRDSIGTSGKLLQNEKLEIDNQSVLVCEIKENALYYKVGKVKVEKRKTFPELMKGYESVYEKIIFRTAKKQENNDILFPYFAFSGNCAAAKKSYVLLSTDGVKKAGELNKDLARMLKIAYRNAKNEKKKAKLKKCYEKDFPDAFKEDAQKK